VACPAAAASGGIITLEDLECYKTITRTPVNITYRGNRIFSTVAPSSGAVVLSALKIFEAWPGSALVDDPAYDLTTHRLIQATRFGYGQRTNYGDPAFTANVSTLERFSDGLSHRDFRTVLISVRPFSEFLEDATVEKVRSMISDTTTYPDSYVCFSLSSTLLGFWELTRYLQQYDPANYIVLADHGTSHLTTADQWGNVVSLTTSKPLSTRSLGGALNVEHLPIAVNLIWGSTVMTPDGIVLNNEMDDFSS
jgi:gamma-glutamyltranspeptidase/glutathione hydrolase